MTNISSILKCSKNIADNDGKLRNIDEIVSEFEKVYDDYDTHAMNVDTENILWGQRDMLEYIIEYLKML